METPELPRIPLTNRAARHGLWRRLAWSFAGACVLWVATVLFADLLFPPPMAGLAGALGRPAGGAPRPKAFVPLELAKPEPVKRPKKHRKDKSPEVLVEAESTQATRAAEPGARQASAKPTFNLVSWIRSVGGGGALGNRFFRFRDGRIPGHPRGSEGETGGSPYIAGRQAPLLGSGALENEYAAGERPIPLGWGEAIGSPVLVRKTQNPDAMGFWAPDLTKGSDVSPEELRQIRASDLRAQHRLETENLLLRTLGGGLIAALWVALGLFASGIAQRFLRPWGKEVTQSEAEFKPIRRR